jgi:LysR family transcriptional regulator, hydrogen peroxide-inducible genes activator
MELHQIRYFLALCRELNFTKAAHACHVSQPALTKAIKGLEDEMGGPLFHRERANTHLTDLGLVLRPHLEQIFNSAETAQSEALGFKKATKTSLTLGVMCTISPHAIVNFLRAIRDRLPSIDLSIVEKPGRQLLDDLIKGKLDIALVGMPNLPDRFHPIPLYRERYGIAFAKGHRFESMNTVVTEELKGEAYVQRTACEFDHHWDAMGTGRDLDVKVVFRSEREDWVQALLAAGFGCAVMPEFLPRLSGVVLRLLVEPEVSRTISLATVAGRRFSPAAAAVVQLAKTYKWDVM